MACGSACVLLGWFLAQPAPVPAGNTVPAVASERAPGSPSSPPVADEELRRTVEELKAEVKRQAGELQAERVAREASAVHSEPQDRPGLRLYGFVDVGVQRVMPLRTSALNLTAPSTQTTFVVGNLNLYVEAEPGDRWTVLVETRLTLAPDGSFNTCPQLGPCVPQTTRVFDNGSPAPWTPLRWGSIVIERAYVQWRFSNLLQIRLGMFLTPFGIWNIDHGTPTLISLLLPNFESNELIPIRQTGLELLGLAQRGDWEWGYFAYVSNGRTPGQLDVTDDKMLGGRLFLLRTYPLRMGIGLSGLINRYSDEERAVASVLPYQVRRRETIAYWEKTGGADLFLDAGPFRLRSEFTVRRLDYVQGKRELAYGNPGVYVPDRLEWNVYALGAYQLPWLGLEPFVYVELYRIPTFLSEAAILPSVGFNIHFAPYAQLKTQYLFVHFSEAPDFFSSKYQDHDIHLVATRLVVAF